MAADTKPNDVYIIRIQETTGRELADILREILPSKSTLEEKEGKE